MQARPEGTREQEKRGLVLVVARSISMRGFVQVQYDVYSVAHRGVIFRDKYKAARATAINQSIPVVIPQILLLRGPSALMVCIGMTTFRVLLPTGMCTRTTYHCCSPFVSGAYSPAAL